MNQRTAIAISAIVGFLGVALGAFGAHGLRTLLEANGRVANWETATHYHLVHAVALLTVALHAPFRAWAWRLWFGGIVIFSGSLYVLALTNQKFLGAITPFGGVLLLAGWLALAFPGKERSPAQT